MTLKDSPKASQAPAQTARSILKNYPQPASPGEEAAFYTRSEGCQALTTQHTTPTPQPTPEPQAPSPQQTRDPTPRAPKAGRASYPPNTLRQPPTPTQHAAGSKPILGGGEGGARQIEPLGPNTRPRDAPLDRDALPCSHCDDRPRGHDARVNRGCRALVASGQFDAADDASHRQRTRTRSNRLPHIDSERNCEYD